MFAVGLVTKIRKEPFDMDAPEFEKVWPVAWENVEAGHNHEPIKFCADRVAAQSIADDLNAVLSGQHDG